ncbi:MULTISPECIES: alpha/beta fold hydrolase [Pseudonocardia]|uniref:alpha/beta fold hydrolase n=1 Tax=Pseudonocardia TaxID=1847 RepID=UPI000CD0EC1F|nr:alpha/beta hydrolase [Pseudonocardia dioxanivorans]GJF03502.1 esterase [Pseudonocardia sp. D17]
MSTYVLVHGAWHTGESWDRVTPQLARAGHHVVAPTLTGYGDKVELAGPDVGLETHVADVVDLLVERDLTDVVLVGHSYAGLVVTVVADRVPERIGRIVFLDAMVPRDGENAIDVMPVSQFLVDAALASESGWRIPPVPELPAPFGLFGVTDPVDIAWLKSTLSDQPVDCLRQRVKIINPAADLIPRTHIHCTVTPEGFERRPVPAVQPNGSPADVRELPTGHDCMITMPEELAEILIELA